LELQNAVSEGFIQAAITDRNARVNALQDRWDRLKRLMDSRGRMMADVDGGGETGLLCRDFKGKDANQEIYRVDTGMLAEMRHIERQAAEELGQWITKTETTTFDAVEMVKLLHEGRARARQNYEARMLACSQDVITVDVEPAKG
jgi:hypothetical protein